MGDGTIETIRVLVAERQTLLRDAMSRALDVQPGLSVVATARDAGCAVAEAVHARIDVAVLDGSMLAGAATDGTIGAIRRAAGCRVLTVSSRTGLDALVGALEAGADGFVAKTASTRELSHAIRVVFGGDMYVPREMLAGLVDLLMLRRREHGEAARRIRRLTRREREVLALLVDGHGNDGIARAAVISPQTARTHVQNVLGKLGVHSRLAAVALVVQTGLADELVGSDSTL